LALIGEGWRIDRVDVSWNGVYELHGIEVSIGRDKVRVMLLAAMGKRGIQAEIPIFIPRSAKLTETEHDIVVVTVAPSIMSGESMAPSYAIANPCVSRGEPKVADVHATVNFCVPLRPLLAESSVNVTPSKVIADARDRKNVSSITATSGQARRRPQSKVIYY